MIQIGDNRLQLIDLCDAYSITSLLSELLTVFFFFFLTRTRRKFPETCVF